LKDKVKIFKELKKKKIYQTSTMEFVLTSFTDSFWERFISNMYNIIANGTLFQIFKLFICTLFPHFECINNCSILIFLIIIYDLFIIFFKTKNTCVAIKVAIERIHFLQRFSSTPSLFVASIST